MAAKIKSGTCRVCGCTERRACIVRGPGFQLTPCWWVDKGHTLCSSPACLAIDARQAALFKVIDGLLEIYKAERKKPNLGLIGVPTGTLQKLAVVRGRF